MHTIYSEDADVQFACHCLNSFFDAFGLEHAVQFIETAFIAATTAGIWKEEDPAGLLYFMERLDVLCTAVFAIHFNQAVMEDAIIIAPEDGVLDITVQQHYTPLPFHASPWSSFCRSLTASQYHNPYKAIKKFCKYMNPAQWKKLCREITESALSRYQDDLFISYDILTTRLHLLRMIEACHLIHIRTSHKNKPQEQTLPDDAGMPTL